MPDAVPFASVTAADVAAEFEEEAAPGAEVAPGGARGSGSTAGAEPLFLGHAALGANDVDVAGTTRLGVLFSCLSACFACQAELLYVGLFAEPTQPPP
jgi:hypothetical protein